MAKLARQHGAIGRKQGTAAKSGATPEVTSFEEVNASVIELCRTERATRYQLGRRLATIRDLELYKQGGFDSFTQYLRSVPGPTTRTLQRYVSLADKVPGDVALAFDAEKLEHALRLVDGTSEAPAIISMKTLRALRIPVERDGEIVEVPFAEATSDELAQAALAQVRRALPAPPPEVEEAKKKLARRLGKGAQLIADLDVKRKRGQHGLELFVPADRIDEFLRLLK